MMKLFLFMSCLLCIALQGKEYPLEHLGIFANALNIEGGRIPRDKLRNDQKWANLCVVLDQPLCTGMDLDLITEENKYVLKECSIHAFDETHVNLAYYNILSYYLQNAHKIAQKDENEIVRIMVQVHRNRSGSDHIALLKALIADIYVHPNVKLSWEYGSEPLVLEKYINQNIIISISMVAGLDSDSTSSTLIVPSLFIPLDLRSMELRTDLTYSIENHLWHTLPQIVLQQDAAKNEEIGRKFISQNPDKGKSKISLLALRDFHRGLNVEVNGMFYPQKLPRKFVLKE